MTKMPMVIEYLYNNKRTTVLFGHNVNSILLLLHIKYALLYRVMLEVLTQDRRPSLARTKNAPLQPAWKDGEILSAFAYPKRQSWARFHD